MHQNYFLRAIPYCPCPHLRCRICLDGIFELNRSIPFELQRTAIPDGFDSNSKHIAIQESEVMKAASKTPSLQCHKARHAQYHSSAQHAKFHSCHRLPQRATEHKTRQFSNSRAMHHKTRQSCLHWCNLNSFIRGVQFLTSVEGKTLKLER